MDKSALGMGKQTVRIGGDMPPGRVEAWPVVWSGWLQTSSWQGYTGKMGYRVPIGKDHVRLSLPGASSVYSFVPPRSPSCQALPDLKTDSSVLIWVGLIHPCP